MDKKLFRPYLGKWIIRDGDLFPEEITMPLIGRYRYSSRFLKSLSEYGLLFDTKEEALRVRKIVMKKLKQETR